MALPLPSRPHQVMGGAPRRTNLNVVSRRCTRLAISEAATVDTEGRSGLQVFAGGAIEYLDVVGGAARHQDDYGFVSDFDLELYVGVWRNDGPTGAGWHVVVEPWLRSDVGEQQWLHPEAHRSVTAVRYRERLRHMDMVGTGARDSQLARVHVGDSRGRWLWRGLSSAGQLVRSGYAAGSSFAGGDRGAGWA